MDSVEDPQLALPVSGQMVVPFECIYYDPSQFENPPASEEEARVLAAKFLDMDDFEMRPRSSGGYRLVPKTD